MQLSPEFLQRYDFDWELLDVVIGGRSAIDSRNRLRPRSAEEIQKFMECYGYDISNPIEKAELFGNFQEAVSFIRRHFLHPENPEGLKIEVPRKILELNDVTQLLVFASSPLEATQQPTLTTMWACCVLKVMHTISHMDKDLRSPYFKDIQTQIFDRFYKFIHGDEKGHVYLGKDLRDNEKVDLVLFESKPKKARDSVIMKLLHKPENVAEDIFDRVGMRFVTKNRFDALRVVKFLKERYVIMPANIKPSRSRNTLVDTKEFSLFLNQMVQEVAKETLAARELDQKLISFFEKQPRNSKSDPNGKGENPHSSEHYESLQFTGRQLIKIKNPLYDDIKNLKAELVKAPSVPEKINQMVDRMDLRNLQKEIRFFYPFEVQIYDERSYSESLAGRSSHSNYKKSQILAAMRRVMGGLTKIELST